MIETELSTAIAAAPTYKAKAQVVWDHYVRRQLPAVMMNNIILQNELEPNWIHFGYELIHKFIFSRVGEKLDADELELVDQIIVSHSLKDGHTVPAFPGQPKSPMRIIHDGWKAGTPTWIFMGRSLTPKSVVHLGGGWVAVQRTIPDEFYNDMDKQAAPATLWMAYNTNQQMGLTALTSNVVGPAVSFNQLWDAVNAEYGPLYKTEANDEFA
jgi:hypothetical protein